MGCVSHAMYSHPPGSASFGAMAVALWLALGTGRPAVGSPPAVPVGPSGETLRWWWQAASRRYSALGVLKTALFAFDGSLLHGAQNPWWTGDLRSHVLRSRRRLVPDLREKG